MQTGSEEHEVQRISHREKNANSDSERNGQSAEDDHRFRNPVKGA